MRAETSWVLALAFAFGCGTSADEPPDGLGGSPAGGSGGATPSAGGVPQSSGGSGGTPSGGTSSGASGAAAAGMIGSMSGAATASGAAGQAGSSNLGGLSGASPMGGSTTGEAGSGRGGRMSGGGRMSASGSAGRSGASGAGAGGSSGAGGSGGGGACVKNLACKLAAPPTTGDLHQDCVNRINQFRTECACMPPLARRMDGEACANQMAEYDAGKNMAHAGSRDDICQPGGAQNECPGYSSNTQVISLCLQQMWDEGPPPMNPCTGACFQEYGHFINMTDTSFTKVACGFYTTASGKVWSVQNFTR